MTTELGKVLKEGQKELQANYNKTVIDHAQNPRNVGNIPNEDGFGKATCICGDTMGIWLKVGNNKIKNITFRTNGCGTTIAAGSMVTELAKGRTIIEASGISRGTILDALGGLPEDSIHCTKLAADTLKNALKDYLVYKQYSWKRPYRRLK